MIGAGAIDLFTPPRFLTNSRIELILNGDLVWLDWQDDPVQLHVVAQQIAGARIDLTSPWLVAEYQFSSVDRTGTLGLINRDTGVKHPVSNLVAGFARLRVPPLSDAPVQASILYLVRSRVPSPQDGFWLATITADDLH
jgi:hypothetical protein